MRAGTGFRGNKAGSDIFHVPVSFSFCSSSIEAAGAPDCWSDSTGQTGCGINTCEGI